MRQHPSENRLVTLTSRTKTILQSGIASQRQFNTSLLLVLTTLIAPLFADAKDAINWQPQIILENSLPRGAFIGEGEGVLIIACGVESGSDHMTASIRTYQYSSNRSELELGSDDAALPLPLAHGASVAARRGLLCIGGQSPAGMSRKVFLIPWTAADESPPWLFFPDLPYPLKHPKATINNSKVYLTGIRVNDQSRVLWEIDLANPIAWHPLPAPPKIMGNEAALEWQFKGEQKFLFLFQGKRAFQYNPKTQEWSVLPEEVPSNTARKAYRHALSLGDTDILHISSAIPQAAEILSSAEPSIALHAYHTVTDTWAELNPPSVPPNFRFMDAQQRNDEFTLFIQSDANGQDSLYRFQAQLDPRSVSLGWVNYSIIAGYLIVLICMGLFFSKREKGTHDYFLGGKRVPWWAAALSIYATQLSALTFISIPAVSYANDWLIFPGKTLLLVAIPIVIFFFLPFFCRLNVTSAYEYLEARFDLSIRLFAGIIFIIFQLVRVGIVAFLPALALATITGINIHLSILLMGALAIVYTTLGGIEAVIWTDVLQFMIFIGGFILCVVLIFLDFKSFGEAWSTVATHAKLQMFDWKFSLTEMTSWGIISGMFLLHIIPYSTDQAVIQRYLTVRDEAAARKSLWANVAMVVPLNILFLGLGTCLWLFFKDHSDDLVLGMSNDQIFPLFIAEQLPVSIAGLVLAGIFSASMSSLDSSMHSISTVITTDFVKRFNSTIRDKHLFAIARGITIAVGILGTVIALLLATFPIQSLVLAFQSSMGLVASSLVVLFTLGIFTKKANSKGTFMGASACAAILLYMRVQTGIHFYFYPVVGIPFGIIIGYLASHAFPTDKKSLNGLTYTTTVKSSASQERNI